MPFIWLNCWVQLGEARKFLLLLRASPCISACCLSAAQPGIWMDYHLNTAGGERTTCLTEVLGVTSLFYSQAHLDRWLEQTALPTRSSID